MTEEVQNGCLIKIAKLQQSLGSQLAEASTDTDQRRSSGLQRMERA